MCRVATCRSRSAGPPPLRQKGKLRRSIGPAIHAIMSQQFESDSWKSRAAGSLAKRNHLLSLKRVGGGLPPSAQSTATLDTSAYSLGGHATSPKFYSEDGALDTAGIISPALGQPPSLPARVQPETLQAAFNESHASRFGYQEGSSSPAPLKALPPHRVQPSRDQGSAAKIEQRGRRPSLACAAPRPRASKYCNNYAGNCSRRRCPAMLLCRRKVQRCLGVSLSSNRSNRT